MSALRARRIRIRSLFEKTRHERDSAAELDSHLRVHIEDNLRKGMTPDEAHRQARLRPGGVEQVKETCRAQRGIPWLETLLQDLRFGLRMLRKNPGFATVALLTMGLGIGATTAIFTVVNDVSPRPLDYPDRVVFMMRQHPQGASPITSIPQYVLWTQQTKILEDFSVHDMGGLRVNLTGGDHPEQLRAMHVSANLFSLIGTRLALGRAFTAAEDIPDGPRLAVIRDGLWRGRHRALGRCGARIAADSSHEQHAIWRQTLGPDRLPPHGGDCVPRCAVLPVTLGRCGHLGSIPSSHFVVSKC
jgi:putative ABC transport system permease protein